MTAARLGYWSSSMVFGIGIAYAVVLAMGFARHGFSEPITDPILTVMEVLTLASAFPLVMLAIAIQQLASGARRGWGIASLCFMVMFATATSAVHVVELTAGRQLGTSGLVWPSVTYAIELVAWDLFLGAALLFAGAALPGQAPRGLRRLLQATGILCLAGLIGPVMGDMRVQRIGVFGYAVLLPVAAFALARWLRVFDTPRHVRNPSTARP